MTSLFKSKVSSAPASVVKPRKDRPKEKILRPSMAWQDKPANREALMKPVFPFQQNKKREPLTKPKMAWQQGENGYK